MDFKNKLTIAVIFFLSACSKPYDYSGSYEATKGADCEVQAGKNTLITVSPVSGEGAAYTARLSSSMSFRNLLPLESKPARINDDGSIVFLFFKEGKAGFFSSKPSVDMKIKLVKKDSSFIYLESWFIEMISPNNNLGTRSFDLIKDAEVSFMGKKVPNEISAQSTKHGLCLRKENL